jgi:hypothetical protein
MCIVSVLENADKRKGLASFRVIVCGVTHQTLQVGVKCIKTQRRLFEIPVHTP